MRTESLFKFFYLTLACIGLFFANALQAQVLLQTSDFDPNEWVDPFQPISFRLSHVPGPSKGRLAFFIGPHDVTALMRMTAPGEYRYKASLSPLPSGENTLIIYLTHDDNRWTELASLPLRVLSAGGFEESEIQLRLDISGQGQAVEDSSDDDPSPETVKTKSLALQGGLSTRHVRKDIDIQTSWNIVGSSIKEEALRFSEKEKEATKVDLSDYLIEIKKGESNFQLGHVSSGNHPLLMSGISNRGITTAWRVFDKLDMSVSAQNGQSITGATNLLGFKDYDNNRINGLSMGLNLMDGSEGQLRVELTYLDAKITAADNFNFGEVTDAQRSDGLGIIIRGNNASGRLRGDIAFARSTFENPVDPFLEQDFDLVESTQTTDNAQSIRIEYDLITPDYDQHENPWSLTASLTHSLTDPFYSSVGAFITPDIRDNGITFAGQAGPVNWQLQHNQTRDNLDDIQTILTTLTRNTVFSASFPLKTMWQSGSAFIPDSLSYDYQRNHQFGDNLPPTFDPDSHIPDQLNKQNSLGLEWQIGSSSLSYTYAESDQDNRQIGRENADFKTQDHGVSLNTSLFESFNINLSLTRTNAEDIEQSLERMTTSTSIGVDWAVSDRFSVSGNISTTAEDDSQNLATNDSDSDQVQLSYRMDMPDGSGGKIPVQTFIRYSSNENKSVDNQFQFESNTENRAINTGFSISFF